MTVQLLYSAVNVTEKFNYISYRKAMVLYVQYILRQDRSFSEILDLSVIHIVTK